MRHNCECPLKHPKSDFFDTCNEILPKEKKYCDNCLKNHLGLEVNYGSK